MSVSYALSNFYQCFPHGAYRLIVALAVADGLAVFTVLFIF
jgi:hypothetical protein